MYLRPAASVTGNTVNMSNILRWDSLCENVNGFYSYYCPMGVTASGVGAAPVVVSINLRHCNKPGAGL